MRGKDSKKETLMLGLNSCHVYRDSMCPEIRSITHNPYCCAYKQAFYPTLLPYWTSNNNNNNKILTRHNSLSCHHPSNTKVGWESKVVTLKGFVIHNYGKICSKRDERHGLWDNDLRLYVRKEARNNAFFGSNYCDCCTSWKWQIIVNFVYLLMVKCININL